MNTSAFSAASQAAHLTVRLGALETVSQRLDRWKIKTANPTLPAAFADYQLTCVVEDGDILDSWRADSALYTLRSFLTERGCLYASISNYCGRTLRQHLLPLAHPRAHAWLRQCTDQRSVAIAGHARPIGMRCKLDFDLGSSFEQQFESQSPSDFEDLIAMSMSLRQDIDAVHEMVQHNKQFDHWIQFLHWPGFSPQSLQVVLDSQAVPTAEDTPLRLGLLSGRETLLME